MAGVMGVTKLQSAVLRRGAPPATGFEVGRRRLPTPEMVFTLFRLGGSM